MDKFAFSQLSLRNLHGVHADLTRVVHLALKLSPVDFRVIEGDRDSARQRQMVLNGRSKTLNSRHLTGHAVDLAPWINRTIPWQDWDAFAQVAAVVKQAVAQLEIPVNWGGDWITLKDGPTLSCHGIAIHEWAERYQ